MHQISKIYFVIKLYTFRASSVPIIRSYLLYAWQLVRFMQVMWPLPSRVRLELQCPQSGVICCTHGNWFVTCRLCDRLLTESGWNCSSYLTAREQPHNLHVTYQLPCVQQITPDDGHRRCPKHVEFYEKINFGYLMHLIGRFIWNLSWCTVTWS
jgi:hypothetical protein